jgi:hypothetical protein
MRRIILYNPHIDNMYAKSLCDWLFRKKIISKYDYILRGLYNDGVLVIFVDRSRSSFESLGRLWVLFFLLKGRTEAILWCLVNHLNPFRIKFIKKKTDLTKEDRLFLFSYLNLDYEDAHKVFFHFPCKLYIHLSHYYLDVEHISTNIRKLNIGFLVSESNLNRSSSFYTHFFGNEHDVRRLPFVFSDRFKKTQAFACRNGTCVALGSLSHTHGDAPRYAAFHKFFKTPYLAPFRKILYDEKERLSGLIDVMIMNPYKGDNSSPNKFQRFVSRFQSPKSNYYSFDIVSILNQYKMFLVPEEAAGLPAALFVEGMACGCVYVGNLNYPIYTDFGMREGVHYVGYSGSLEDLIEKVNFYNENRDALEKIANAGFELAIHEFSRVTNYQRFIELYSEHETNNYSD